MTKMAEIRTVMARPSDREIVFTREFDAPRELVFEVWTDVKHLEQWWGPNGFRTENSVMDLRPGGSWTFTMTGPDGRVYPNKVVYVDVAPPERLVYQHEGDGGTLLFSTTTTFDELSEGRTKVTMHGTFSSAEALEYVIKNHDADKGGLQTLEKGAAHVASLPMTRREVTLTRRFDAKRADVWRAWTDAEILRQWWGPKGFTNPVCEVDARVGGTMKIVMRSPFGTKHPMRAVFQVVNEPEVLVFTNTAVDAEGHALLTGLTTVTFEEIDGKTELTMHTSMTTMQKGMPMMMIEGMKDGWSQSLDRLEKLASAGVVV
jgi:uncharacterized protein YndB with AHSA1/START domain